MKRIVYALIVTVTVICAGCEKKEPTAAEAAEMQPPPPASEYRKLLEKREKSVRGAEINIRQEVNAYENASDDEKKRLFKKQKHIR